MNDLVQKRPFSEKTNLLAVIYSSKSDEAIKERFNKARYEKTGDHLLMGVFADKTDTFLSLLMILTKIDLGNPALLYYYSDAFKEIAHFLNFVEAHRKVEKSLEEEEGDLKLSTISSEETINRIKANLEEIQDTINIEN